MISMAPVNPHRHRNNQSSVSLEVGLTALNFGIGYLPPVFTNPSGQVAISNSFYPYQSDTPRPQPYPQQPSFYQPEISQHIPQSQTSPRVVDIPESHIPLYDNLNDSTSSKLLIPELKYVDNQMYLAYSAAYNALCQSSPNTNPYPAVPATQPNYHYTNTSPGPQTNYPGQSIYHTTAPASSLTPQNSPSPLKTTVPKSNPQKPSPKATNIPQKNTPLINIPQKNVTQTNIPRSKSLSTIPQPAQPATVPGKNGTITPTDPDLSKDWVLI